MSMGPTPPVDATQTQRPSMRRKSSAQNLLSSFKPSSAINVNTVPSATGLQYASAPTPTSTVPLARDWDTQTFPSESGTSSTGSFPMPNGAQGVQGTTVEILREIVKKRIITLTYLRNVHEGCVIPFSFISIEH